MSGKVRVGTNKLTFTVSAFDYPREDFATAVVDVPVYAKSDNVLKDQRSMSVEAGMPEDFNEKVEHAWQVFADTLEASFKRGDDIMTDWVDRVFGRHVEAPYDRAYSSDGMPTKPGWYVTRDGEDLLSYDGDAWHIHNLECGAEPFADGDMETMDWSVVKRTFGADSFPLIPVNPREPSPKKHLTAGDAAYPSRASNMWLLAIGRVLGVDAMMRLVRQTAKEKETDQ